MEVTLRDASTHRAIVDHLNQLYLYDFSEFGRRDVRPDGLYEASYLDAYWSNEDRRSFVLLVDDQIAGFTLLHLPDGRAHPIGEFFAMRKYRRKGVAATAAVQVFDMFPGQWTVRQFPSNVGARGFWRTVIDRYTSGRFTEEEHSRESGGWTQSFDNSRA